MARVRSWRPRKHKIDHLQIKQDISNVSPSTARDAIDDAIGQIAPDLQDQQILHQRRAEALMGRARAQKWRTMPGRMEQARARATRANY